MRLLHRVVLAAVSAAFFIGSAQAQNGGTVTQHAFAIGKGAGIGGYTSLLCPSGQIPMGQTSADPQCVAISGDGAISAAGVLTLSTVNSNVGSFGSATQAPAITVNAKGLITAASANTITPTIGSVTGLGTGCGTFLGTPSSANLRGCLTDEVGTGAAYFVGGALGTPASGTLTNATGLPLSGLNTQAANTVVANATGSTASPTAVSPATARSSSLLNVDSFTGHGDSPYTILATDRTIGTNAAFTASRTWTLPSANAVNPGQEIIVADFQGTVTGTNTLVISRAGTDTINGVTSVTIASANGAYLFKSDGISKWTAQALGAAAAGGVSSVTCGTGLSGGTITTSGTCAVNLTGIQNVLGADVTMNNTSNYFDGPSVAQGTSGTWFASGTVTLNDASGATQFFCKLWDGTTIISSSDVRQDAASEPRTLSLSGIISSPAANIRISCKDLNFTTGTISFNLSGNSKDSAVTAIRIQ